MPNIPEKRTNPFEKTLNQMREEQTKKEDVVEKKAEKKATPKKAASEKKSTASKKTTTKKSPAKKPAKVKIDSKTGVAKVVESKAKATTKKADAKKSPAKTTTTKESATSKKATTPKKVATKKTVEPAQIVETNIPVVEVPVQIVEPKEETPVKVDVAPVVNPTEEVVPVKKPRKISKRAQLLKEQKAAERAAAKAAKLIPVEIVRPVPKKFKLTTKEEKAQFKKLEESFDYIVNLASVVEEKTMNKEEIPDITLGELHVIQMVNKYNNKPMTLIANKLKVTVGSLITCLNRLIQKDYIVRTRDEMDNRVILLTVTQKAKKVLKAHDKFHDDILGLLLENGVTLAQATKVLATLVTTLEVYYDPIHNSFETKEKGSKAKKK